MQNDSDIISYTTWSLNNDSPLSIREKLHRRKEDDEGGGDGEESGSGGGGENEPDGRKKKTVKKESQQEHHHHHHHHHYYHHDNPGGMKHEVKTFCCFLSFFTLKSFRFHSIPIFMTLMVFLGLFESMVQGGYLAAIMSTIQIQFNMSTGKIGLILSAFDIMGVVATPTLAYIGSRYNKCKIIGICGFFYVLGTVIYTLPYFFSPKYTVSLVNNPHTTMYSRDNNSDMFDSTVDMCKFRNVTTSVVMTTLFTTTDDHLITDNVTNFLTTTPAPDLAHTPCDRDTDVSWTYAMFIIAQLFMSLGSAPLFSLGITYLCDNVEERKHATYTGVVYGSFALGPALGYITASILLAKWLYMNEVPPIDEKDPRWVGCWYPGLLLAGGVVFILSALLCTFPEHLTEQRRLEIEQKRELRRKAKIEAKKQRLAMRRSEADGNVDGGGGGETDKNAAAAAAKVAANKLETIDEEATDEITAEIDRSFEFLDSEHSGIGSTTNDDSISSSPSIFTVEQTAHHHKNKHDEHRHDEEHHQTQQQQQQQQSGSGRKWLQVPREHIKHRHQSLIIKTQDLQDSLLLRIQHSHLKFKGLLSSLISLLLNLRYSLLVLILSIECVLVAAFTNYMVLYTQHVYQIPSSKTSILVGGVVVPAAIVGAILGGILVRKFNMGIEGCVRLIMVSSSIVVIGLFVLLFIDCTGPISVGVDKPAQDFNTNFDTCNSNCACRSVYNPTCGVDLKTYVSPCYAGCKYSDSHGYYDCGCIAVSLNQTTGSIIENEDSMNNDTIMAYPNACSRHCDSKLVIFLIILFVVVASESLCLTPATMTILKLIDKPLQPFALGVLRCANILIAYIPAPIVLSNIIDKTCALWSKQCLGDKGTCLEYDSVTFHYWLFGFTVGIKIFSCILLIVLSIYTHKAYILRRKYHSRVTLHHDPFIAPSRRHKYRIDSVVASSYGGPSSDSERESTSLDSLSYLIRFRRSSNTDSNSSSHSVGNNNNNNNANNNNNNHGKNHRESTPSVVLKRHVVFNEDFTSLARVQTPTEISLMESMTAPTERKDSDELANPKTTGV